jgi:putative Mg2+ transporter-C (MgtC) family protein
VRGLTTAASIWITAALGILFGVGFFLPAVVGTAATLGTLGFFRWIERYIPSEFYAHHALKFAGNKVTPEAEVRRLIEQHGFSISNLSYRQDENGKSFEYRMIIKSSTRDNVEKLVETLRGRKDVLEFRLSPTGD